MTSKISASDHPIKSVTVFKSSKAEVVRLFPLELKAGQNKVEISGLPSSIDTSSLRVSGVGAARILDVVCTIDTNVNAADPLSITGIIDSLLVQKANLEHEEASRHSASQIMQNYANSLVGEHVAPPQMMQFLAAFNESSQRDAKTKVALEKKLSDIDQQISLLQKKAQLHKGTAHGQVTVVIGTEEASAVQLKLTYMVHGAVWEPTYELHATTENGLPSSSVSLYYRARVTQSTGEDWTDTALTLSTVSSDAAQRIPTLSSLKITRIPPPAPAKKRSLAFAQPSAVSASFIFDNAGTEDIIIPKFSEASTIVTETPLSVTFSVEGKSTIPSDGIPHQASIAVLPFTSTVSHVSVPRLEPRVYLQCKVKNESEYRLLPGPVTILLDDSFVSRTFIQDINTGDTFDCTLGADSSCKVTYVRTTSVVHHPVGAFSGEALATTTYSTKITVSNKHAFPLTDLIVREVIPMGNEQIKVILKKPAGLAEAKDEDVVQLGDEGLNVRWSEKMDGKGGEQQGKFEWRWKVEAGTMVELQTEWDIKAPVDIPLTEVMAL